MIFEEVLRLLNIYRAQRKQKHKRLLRYWDEEWRRPHGEGCDCDKCTPPWMAIVRSTAKSGHSFSYQDIWSNEDPGGMCSVKRVVYALRECGEVHLCWTSTTGRNVFELGPAERCKAENHRGFDRPGFCQWFSDHDTEELTP
jgi:hypothetical protein